MSMMSSSNKGKQAQRRSRKKQKDSCCKHYDEEARVFFQEVLEVVRKQQELGELEEELLAAIEEKERDKLSDNNLFEHNLFSQDPLEVLRISERATGDARNADDMRTAGEENQTLDASFSGGIERRVDDQHSEVVLLKESLAQFSLQVPLACINLLLSAKFLPLAIEECLDEFIDEDEDDHSRCDKLWIATFTPKAADDVAERCMELVAKTDYKEYCFAEMELGIAAYVKIWFKKEWRKEEERQREQSEATAKCISKSSASISGASLQLQRSVGARSSNGSEYQDDKEENEHSNIETQNNSQIEKQNVSRTEKHIRSQTEKHHIAYPETQSESDAEKDDSEWQSNYQKVNNSETLGIWLQQKLQEFAREDINSGCSSEEELDEFACKREACNSWSREKLHTHCQILDHELDYLYKYSGDDFPRLLRAREALLDFLEETMFPKQLCSLDAFDFPCIFGVSANGLTSQLNNIIVESDNVGSTTSLLVGKSTTEKSTDDSCSIAFADDSTAADSSDHDDESEDSEEDEESASVGRVCARIVGSGMLEEAVRQILEKWEKSTLDFPGTTSSDRDSLECRHTVAMYVRRYIEIIAGNRGVAIEVMNKKSTIGTQNGTLTPVVEETLEDIEMYCDPKMPEWVSEDSIDSEQGC